MREVNPFKPDVGHPPSGGLSVCLTSGFQGWDLGITETSFKMSLALSDSLIHATRTYRESYMPGAVLGAEIKQ